MKTTTSIWALLIILFLTSCGTTYYSTYYDDREIPPTYVYQPINSGYDYFYSPELNFYYYPTTNMFWWYDGSWRNGYNLPARYIITNHTTYIIINIKDKRPPYYYNVTHRNNYNSGRYNTYIKRIGDAPIKNFSHPIKKYSAPAPMTPAPQHQQPNNNPTPNYEREHRENNRYDGGNMNNQNMRENDKPNQGNRYGQENVQAPRSSQDNENKEMKKPKKKEENRPQSNPNNGNRNELNDKKENTNTPKPGYVEAPRTNPSRSGDSYQRGSGKTNNTSSNRSEEKPKNNESNKKQGGSDTNNSNQHSKGNRR